MLQLKYHNLELSTCIDCTLNYKVCALMQDKHRSLYLQQTSSSNGHAFCIICYTVVGFLLLGSGTETSERIQHSCVFPAIGSPFSNLSLQEVEMKVFNFGGGRWDFLLKIIFTFLCLTWYRECSYQQLARTQCASHI